MQKQELHTMQKGSSGKNLAAKDEKKGQNLISKNANSEGLIPNISNHYAALPCLYDFDNIAEEKLSDTITRQFVMGSHSMVVKWTFKKGAVIPLHFHPNEQITWIISGLVQVKSQGKTFLLKEGSVIVFPAYVPHEFVMLEDTIDIDFFTPVRNDWLTQDTYLKPLQK